MYFGSIGSILRIFGSILYIFVVRHLVSNATNSLISVGLCKCPVKKPTLGGKGRISMRAHLVPVELREVTRAPLLDGEPGLRHGRVERELLPLGGQFYLSVAAVIWSNLGL
jgi:hypothetical protein